MDAISSGQQHKTDPYSQNRKRKRKHKQAVVVDDDDGFNKLPDDVIIAILSRLSPKEAARTSILCRRWRYLWFCSSGTLEFDDSKMFTSRDRIMFSLLGYLKFKPDEKKARRDFLVKKYIAWVSRIMKLQQGLPVHGLTIRFLNAREKSPFGRRPGYIDNWIFSAMDKDLKMLKLIFPGNPYEFPSLDLLLSRSPDSDKFGFAALRSLTFVGVDVKDKVVRHFLGSCPFLEKFCLMGSSATKRLRFVDPLPSLKVLEISDCLSLKFLKISASSIVSCMYKGPASIFPFKKTARNLSWLTLDGQFAQFFIYEPSKHMRYSARLEKLALNILWDKLYDPKGSGRVHPDLPRLCSLRRLELNVISPIASIQFFVSLIKAAPLLTEFVIKISYEKKAFFHERGGFPDVGLHRYRFRHKNLKTVKMSGYVGCRHDDSFLLRLLKIGRNLETMTVDTESDYYEQEPCNCAANINLCVCFEGNMNAARTRAIAVKRAQRFKARWKSRLGGKVVFNVM